MKMILPFLLLLCSLSAETRADSGGRVPLDKRASLEKLELIEQYQVALKRCREEKKRTDRNTCIERKKDQLKKVLSDLDDNPKAYFTAQERKHQGEQFIQEVKKAGPR